MNSEKNGGPAFPLQLLGTTGMSLRDYFAAHAPADYHSWFTPTMPERPAPQFDHDHPNERRCQQEFDCHAVNAEELSAYDDARREQYELQWPYAWADAMLTLRAKAVTR